MPWRGSLRFFTKDKKIKCTECDKLIGRNEIDKHACEKNPEPRVTRAKSTPFLRFRMSRSNNHKKNGRLSTVNRSQTATVDSVKLKIYLLYLSLSLSHLYFLSYMCIILSI